MASSSSPHLDTKFFAVLLRHVGVLDEVDGADSDISERALKEAALLTASPADKVEAHLLPVSVQKLRLFLRTFTGKTGATTVDAYLARLMHFGGTAARSCGDIAAILLCRMRDKLKEWVQLCPEHVHLPLHMVIPSPILFRCALTAMALAVKLHSDEFSSMKYYAGVGGVQVRQLLTFEKVFLELIDYDIDVSYDQFHKFQHTLNESNNAELRQLCAVFLCHCDGFRDDSSVFDDEHTLSDAPSSVHTPISQRDHGSFTLSPPPV